MNNNPKYNNCPPRMSDGRHFTDYRPNCMVNNLVQTQNNVPDTYQYRLFLTESHPTVFNPAAKIDDRYTIVEHLTSKVVKRVDSSDKKIAQFRKQDKDLRLLSYEILVERFNTKYSNLSAAQRNLLKEYINNVSNTNSLKEFVESESTKIKKQLKSFLPKIKNKITKIKLQEAINQLDSVHKGRLVKDKQVVSLMRYYELIKELNHVCKT